MKERGELAYEAFRRSRLDIEPAHLTWGSLTNDTAAEYAAIERAIRNAALEEAAARISGAPLFAAAIRAMKEPT